MADNLVYELSTSTELSGEPFTEKQWVYLIDQNNGSYQSNQIILDTSSLSNSGKYVDYSQAYISVPVCVALTAPAGVAIPSTTDFAVAVKNGHYQLINSMTVQYNNSSVIQTTSFSNFHVNYKLITSMSLDDVKNTGASIGFSPDSASSWSYDAGGLGFKNNTITPNLDSASTYAGTAYNAGMYDRQINNATNLTAQGLNGILDESKLTYVNKSFTKNITVGAKESKVWWFEATIRLKDIHDFFNKIPLCRGSFIKFYLNLNQSWCSFTVAGGAGAITPASVAVNVFGGGSCPFMISAPTSSTVSATITGATVDATAGTGISVAAGTAGFGTNAIPPVYANTSGALDAFNISGATISSATLALSGGSKTLADGAGYVLSMSVLQPISGSGQPTTELRNPFQTSCRLYAPLYVMNPIKEEQYLSLNRTKTIKYRDIYQYQFESVGAGTNFNYLVSNGIANLKEIVVMPFFSKSVNGVLGISPFQSPFDTAPATTSPCAVLSNVNFQISNINAFNNNTQYDYEAFLHELKGVNSINGGLTTGLSSGLVGAREFSNNYRYYVCDVSRRLPEEDKVPKSIQIKGTNETLLPMDLYVFAVFETEITIDTFTGQRVA
jgi:hypothetical protein